MKKKYVLVPYEQYRRSGVLPIPTSSEERFDAAKPSADEEKKEPSAAPPPTAELPTETPLTTASVSQPPEPATNTAGDSPKTVAKEASGGEQETYGSVGPQPLPPGVEKGRRKTTTEQYERPATRSRSEKRWLRG